MELISAKRPFDNVFFWTYFGDVDLSASINFPPSLQPLVENYASVCFGSE